MPSTRRSHGVEGGSSIGGSAEPKLLSGGSPSESLFSGPLARERLLVATQIDEGHPPTVIVFDLMLHEGDQVPFWRNPRPTEITVRLVEHLADRIFQPVTPIHPAHDGELGSIRRPVSLLHVFKDFTWRSTVQRHPR